MLHFRYVGSSGFVSWQSGLQDRPCKRFGWVSHHLAHFAVAKVHHGSGGGGALDDIQVGERLCYVDRHVSIQERKR